MNKVVKDHGFGEWKVTDESGKVLGTFYFSRSRSKIGVLATCIVRPAFGAEFRTAHCYFADVRKDAICGNLFQSCNRTAA